MKPNSRFAKPADSISIDTTLAAMRTNGFEALIVQTSAAVRDLVLDRLPKGAEVFTISSETLRLAGVTEAINDSGDYISIRHQLTAEQDPGRKRKLGAAPDYAVGSVQAVTEAGHLWIASATGSQLASCVYGAEHVIYVVGAQKLVADNAAALARIDEYALPLESLRSQEKYGTDSRVGKLLQIKDDKPGRTTVIIINESIGY